MYAFAVPIPSGKIEDVRRLFAALPGPRKAEYEDLARRSDVTEEHYWLQVGSTGDFLVVASDSDQAGYQAILANAETGFDHWMRSEDEERIFDVAPDSPPAPRNESLGVLRL